MGFSRLFRAGGLVAGCAALLSAQQLHANRTEYLDLVDYSEAHEYLTGHVIRCFENSMGFHRRLFGYTPSEPVTVLLQDWGDFGHGGTRTLPYNFVSIGIEPFNYVFDTMPANERMNWLMNHELAHVVACDKAAGRDLRFRRWFHGKVTPNAQNPESIYYSYLTNPRWYAPRWYHEGIATFLETWMAGGLGRALGGYDEMVFRAKVLEHARFYDVVGLESEGTTIDFQVGQNAYLYGTRFVTWLAMTYGPEKVLAWFNRTEGSAPYFSTQFKRVFGMPVEQAWHAWIDWEQGWQAQNLARIRQYPVTPARPIPTGTLGSVSKSFFEPSTGLVYTAIRRPAKVAQVVALDPGTGRIRPLAEVINPAIYFVTSLAFDAKDRKLFFTSNQWDWRNLNVVDLATGRTRRLLKGFRAGDLALNPADQSLWAVRHDQGLSSLIRIEKPYKKWTDVLDLAYGRELLDLDIAPDGRTLTATMIEIDGTQKLVEYDLAALDRGETAARTLHLFENNTPANFVHSQDGRYLFGTSYLTGVSNIFRYDFQTGRMEAVSNAETGLFRPLPLGPSELLAYNFTAAGFAPVRLPIVPTEDLSAIHYLGQEVVDTYPVVKTWNAGSPARVDLDQVLTYHGPYQPMGMVKLASVYPVVEGYKSTVAVGVRANFADPLALRTGDLTLAYTPDPNLPREERFHVKINLARLHWKLALADNATDFYDLFGPTKVSLKGYSAALAYNNTLISEAPRELEYTLSGATYGHLDSVPGFQNVTAPYTAYQTGGAELVYKYVRRTLGAVEPEYGWSWKLSATGNRANATFFPKYQGSLDLGMLLPLDHSSLWLRSSAGRSREDPTNAFAEFYFGAFGNNYVDHQEVRRYRDPLSFPGLALDQLGGNDFAKETVEWTLPPMRFSRLGVPGLYASWARLALFSSYVVVNTWSRPLRQEARNIGGQLDIALTLFSDLDSTLSFGVAAARPEGGPASREFMASLKLLR